MEIYIHLSRHGNICIHTRAHICTMNNKYSYSLLPNLANVYFERASFPAKKVTCPSDCGSDRDDTRPFHPRPVCLSSDRLYEFVTRWLDCARKIPDRRRGDILLMYTSLVGRPPRPPRSSCPAQVSGVACGSKGGQVRQEEVKCVMWGSYFGL